MKRITTVFALAAALVSSPISLRLAAAENHGHSHDHAGHSHGEIVAYRAAEWKTMHFEDPALAAQHLKAVQDLGCEAKQDNHNGHIDVTYRCPTWRQVPVQTHKLAEQWLVWMKGAGFDVHHPHVDEQFLHGDEVVEIRLSEWKQAHLEGQTAAQAGEFSQTLQKLGCEVRSQNHGDHIDLAFRCPIWVAVHVPNHDAAQQWQTWLKSHGFETKHSH
jgi:hypothetical protein